MSTTSGNEFPDLLSAPNAAYSELIAGASHKWLISRAVGDTAMSWVQDEVGDNWEYGYSQRRGQIVRQLLTALRGQRVVELGCGPGLRRFQHLLGQPEYAPVHYLGVDQGNDFAGRPAIRIPGLGEYAELSTTNGDPLNGALVNADMLDLLSRLPDGYGSFVLNGIDDFIIRRLEPYGLAVAREIGRVTADGGVVVGMAFATGIHAQLPHQTSLVPDPLLSSLPNHVTEGVFSYIKPAATPQAVVAA